MATSPNFGYLAKPDELLHRYAMLAERYVFEDPLEEALLGAAFRGELVPHDPADEPASAFLERIRVDRETTTSKPKHSRRKALALAASTHDVSVEGSDRE